MIRWNAFIRRANGVKMAILTRGKVSNNGNVVTAVGRLNPRGSGCSSLLTVCSPYGSSSLEKATRVGSSAYIHPALAHLSHYPLPANRSNRCNHIFTTDALDYAKSRCHLWDKEIGRFDLEQPNLTQYVQYFY